MSTNRRPTKPTTESSVQPSRVVDKAREEFMTKPIQTSGIILTACGIILGSIIALISFMWKNPTTALGLFAVAALPSMALWYLVYWRKRRNVFIRLLFSMFFAFSSALMLVILIGHSSIHLVIAPSSENWAWTKRIDAIGIMLLGLVLILTVRTSILDYLSVVNTLINLHNQSDPRVRSAVNDPTEKPTNAD